MNKPPITLIHPTYVVEYAVVDTTVTFINRQKLNVGGEWLGEVPKLAISQDIAKSNFQLCHCNEEWESLCCVEQATTIAEIKEIAERHYQGIHKNWKETNYQPSDAIDIFSAEEEKMRCSFCENSLYDNYYQSLVHGKKANICNVCIDELGEETKS